MNTLKQALDKITITMLSGLGYGEMIELNDKYTLYHYSENDFISVFREDDWEELLAVSYDTDTGAIDYDVIDDTEPEVKELFE